MNPQDPQAFTTEELIKMMSRFLVEGPPLKSSLGALLYIESLRSKQERLIEAELTSRGVNLEVCCAEVKEVKYERMQFCFTAPGVKITIERDTSII